MPRETSPTPRSTAEHVDIPHEVACDASTACEQFSGKGWIELDEMANRMTWRHSRLTAVLRWLRQESPVHVFETKVSSGIVKVRITEPQNTVPNPKTKNRESKEPYHE